MIVGKNVDHIVYNLKMPMLASNLPQAPNLVIEGGRAVLSVADNEILTRIGPGTMMGNLLRRYWMPACLVTELPEAGGAPIRVRLLGEDLILFRDISGRLGLVDEYC